MFFGLGFTLGPSIGGLIYELGGFSAPFFVTSMLTLIAALFAFFSLETKLNCSNNGDDEEPREKVTIYKLLTTFSISINILMNITAAINFGFMDATLEHHIRDFTNLSPSKIGFIFMTGGTVYAISGQVFGIIIDKVNGGQSFCLFGFICSLVCYTICGPVFPFTFSP